MRETIGEYIRKLRLENKITLTKLAAALDLDQSTLSKIETLKKNVPEEILPKLASFFKLDIKKLQDEYYSEKIAEILYKEENSSDILKLAEEKAKIFRTKKMQQTTFKF